MMKAPYISILLLGLALGCESTMDYPVIQDEGKFYLECFPSSGTDSTLLVLHRTYPINKPREAYDWNHVQVHLSINDRPVEWANSYDYGNGILLKTPTVPAEGDQITVSIQDIDHSPIVAHSSVPPAPSFTYTRELTPKWDDRYHILLEREDKGKRDYFGVLLEGKYRHKTVFPDGRIEITEDAIPDLYYSVNGTYNTSISDETEGKFRMVSVAGQKMFLFEVKEGEDNPFVLNVDTGTAEDRPEWFHVGIPTTRSTHFRLTLFRISQSAYRFLAPKENKSLSGAGLTSPFDVQGNLLEAFGMFDCMGGATIDWLPSLSSAEQ